MALRRSRLAIMSLATLGITLVPQTALASTHAMRTTHIVINTREFSSPKAFTYKGTTYMPLFYVQRILTAVGIQNNWDASHTPQVWTLNTQQPLNVTLNLVAKSGSVNVVINGKTVCRNIDKVVDVDPASNVKTTFVPIWYIQQVLKAIGLESTWNGTTWTVKLPYTAYSKSGKLVGGFTSLQDAEHALLQYPGGVVLDASGNTVYTEADFVNVDLRYPAPSNVTADSIDKFLADHQSPLAGLGASFIAAQNTYGVNANYLVSHAIEETAWGVSPLALSKNNLFGYGAFDQSPDASAAMFPSEDYAIRFQAWAVRTNYLTPGAIYYVTPTLAGMQQNYASDKNWANSIGQVMNQFAINLGDNVTSYTQYSANTSASAPAPAATDEPLYYLNGAQGTVQQTPYYSALPVYPDMASGVKQMFTRPLKSGDRGDDVETLQAALNQQLGTQLDTDGKFGPMTQAAVQQYQSLQGMAVTGVCDFAMWQSLQIGAGVQQLSPGTAVNIDQIKIGMAGGTATDWYHIAGQGWVNGNFVSFKNVYRLTVTNPTSLSQVSVPVYSAADSSAVIARLRAGDFVVANGTTSGTVTIQFADQSSGQLETGVVKGISLTKVGS